MGLKIGDDLPVFSLKDQDGTVVNSQDWLGQPVVIYFYPSDFTKICTTQACSFRNHHEEFEDLGVPVVGISHNPSLMHKQFAKKYELPFLLLSDVTGKVRKKFGATGGMLGLIPGRVTYVFDKAGKLIYLYDKPMEAKEHVLNALRTIQAI